MAELRLDVNVDVHGQDRLNNLGRTLAGGAVHFAKFAAAGIAATAALGGVTANFASDLNESLSKVGVVFGKNAKDIEAWSKTSADSLGLSQRNALEAAGTFGNLFSAMKIGEQPTLDMSKGLVELSADLASFNNLKPEEVLEKLRAGIVGEAEPLRSLGIQISAARTEAKAMELGFKKVDGQLSASAKAQANYALIMEDSVKAQGDFERTSGGMANQQRILAATFEDTMAAIGQAFIPIIQELLPGVTAGLKAFGGWVTENMPAIKAVIGTVFGGIGTAISFIFTEVVPKVIEVFSSLFSTVQSNMPSIQEIVSGVFTKIGEVVQWVSTNVFPPLIAAFQAVVGWVTANWPTIESIIGSVFAFIGETMQFLIKNVIPTLVNAFAKVVGWVSANWPTISSVIGQVFGAVSNAVKVVWPIVARVAEVLFPLVSTAATILFKALDGTFKLIGGIFEVVGNTVDTMVKGITDAWRTLSLATEVIWNFLGDIIKGAINVVIDLINGFLGFLNGLSFGMPPIDVGPIHIDGFSVDPFNIPLIPRLAEGGIVTSPTLAMIGERGSEAVIPLDQLENLGRTVNIYVQGEVRDEEQLLSLFERSERLNAALAGG